MNELRATLAGRWVEIPLVAETRCTGCGVCAEVCPTDCLEMDGPLPWLPRPGDCISCGLCVAICPVEALRLCRMEE